MAMNPEVTRLAEINEQLIGIGKRAVNMVRAHKGKLDALEERWDLPTANKNEGKKLQWQQFESAASMVGTERVLLENERKRLVEKLTAGHRQPGGIEEELRRQAAWSRLEKKLDGTAEGQLRFVGAINILEGAAATGDTATLEAARRELPAYLERHGERLPNDTRVWLDLNGGPPEAVAARVMEQVDAKDRATAGLAVDWLGKAVRKREVPDFMPDPNGNEGQRVVWLNGDDE